MFLSCLAFRISIIHNSFWLWITRRRHHIILYKINPSKSSRGLAGLTAVASKRVKSKNIKLYSDLGILSYNTSDSFFIFYFVQIEESAEGIRYSIPPKSGWLDLVPRIFHNQIIKKPKCLILPWGQHMSWNTFVMSD